MKIRHYIWITCAFAIGLLIGVNLENLKSIGFKNYPEFTVIADKFDPYITCVKDDHLYIQQLQVTSAKLIKPDTLNVMLENPLPLPIELEKVEVALFKDYEKIYVSDHWVDQANLIPAKASRSQNINVDKALLQQANSVSVRPSVMRSPEYLHGYQIYHLRTQKYISVWLLTPDLTPTVSKRIAEEFARRQL